MLKDGLGNRINHKTEQDEYNENLYLILQDS